MVADTAVDSIFRFSVCSRIFLLCLSLLSNFIVPDHQASDVFIYKYKYDKSQDLQFLDHIIYALFGGLIRWDANYFLHIAHYGYTEENMLAFFPLFPCTVRVVASLMHIILSGFVTYDALLLLSSVLLNFVLFVKSSTLLYKLTLKIVKNYDCAYYSAIIFCVNPASIFFSAPYSEALFSYLTFLAVLNSFNGNFLVASLITGLSCATRSNGIVNIGFVLYTFVVFFLRRFSLSLSYLLTFVLILGVFIVVSLAPFYLFQLYSYVMFCPNVGSVSPVQTMVRTWCNDAIPLAYRYVQSKYWNVGFLKYYEIKQLPNFLLAAPIIFILLNVSYKKITSDKELLRKIASLRIVSEINSDAPGTIDRLNYLVTVVHVVLLTVFCVLFVHIQVSTRMLCSSSPVFYWFVADCFRNNYDSVNSSQNTRKIHFDFAKRFNRGKPSDCAKINRQMSDTIYSTYIRHYWKMFSNKSCTWTQVFLIVYCLGYFVTGTVLFSNFYPWT